ncbi:MAG: alanine racemase [Deltaproteobacteria bacterium]|nr:alanine racemase [Deltaproteobacteria bacterium]
MIDTVVHTSNMGHHLRPTWVEIHQSALQRNFHVVRESVGQAIGIIAMVKADAYGHGAVPVARWCVEAGAEALGVATLEEGIELRDAGLTCPILVMCGLAGQGAVAADVAVAQNFTCVVHSAETLRLLDTAAKRRSSAASVHLKIDTGMTRMGMRPESLMHLLDALDQSPAVRVAGVMTHLAHVVDRESTARQVACFTETAAIIRRHLRGPLVWHLGNSAAVLERRLGREEWCAPFALAAGDRFAVRPGIMLYGILPFSKYAGGTPLAPVMSLKSRWILIKHVPADTAVSYSGTWRTARPSRLAVLPVGYADGYPWGLANHGVVLACGRRLPVVGRVTMDMTICDVTDLAQARVGDTVTLLGAEGNDVMTAEEMAERCQTIPYEIVCRMSKRVPRIYLPALSSEAP